jgi:hypothetical protein
MTAKVYIFVGADGAPKRVSATRLATVIHSANKTVLNETAGIRALNTQNQVQQSVTSDVANLIDSYGATVDALVIRCIGLEVGEQLSELYNTYKDSATFIFLRAGTDYSNIPEDMLRRWPALTKEEIVAKLLADSAAVNAFVASLGKEYVETGIPMFANDLSLTTPAVDQEQHPAAVVMGSLAL